MSSKKFGDEFSFEEKQMMQTGVVETEFYQSHKFQNRQYKFRAWLFKDQSMKSIKKIDLGKFYEDESQGDSMHLMAFTEVHDPEGRDIYEGDVLCGKKGDKTVLYRILYYEGAYVLTDWPEKYKPPLNIKGHMDEFFQSTLTPFEEKRLSFQVVGHIYESLEVLQSRTQEFVK